MAWAITDSENTEHLTEFFQAIKTRVPVPIVQTLVTDDGNESKISYLS